MSYDPIPDQPRLHGWVCGKFLRPGVRCAGRLRAPSNYSGKIHLMIRYRICDQCGRRLVTEEVPRRK